MKMQKRGLVFLSFILSVLSHRNIEKIPRGLFVDEVVKWSEDYWNYLKTGYLDASVLSQRFGDTCYRDKKNVHVITSRVIQSIPQITTQLTEFSNISSQRSLNLNEQIRELELSIVIDERLSSLANQIGVIDSIYEELNDSIPARRIMEFKGATHCIFATRQLYYRPLSQEVNAMYKIVVPTGQLVQDGWLEAIKEHFQPYQNTLCDTGHSILDYFYSIYASLIITEIKAYVITAFSHTLLYNFEGNGPQCIYGQDADGEMLRVMEKLHRHIQNYNNVFRKLMKGVSKEFRACDNKEYFPKGKTFWELEGAIQTVVQHPDLYQVAYSGTHSVIQCKDFGKYYNSPAAYCDDKIQFCPTPVARKCLGIYPVCWAMEHKIEGCLSAKHSSRRYEWFEKRGWFIWPKYKDCPESRKMYLKNSYSEYASCYCTCIDNNVDSRSTHVFNLQWVESDVSKNMVITGIRFIVKHRVMQLQIQQGKLGTNFQVKKSEWKPVNDISEAIRAARLNKLLRGKWPNLTENNDYFIIGEDDAINFDTLNVSYPNVLTGVRFYHRPENPDSHRRIQIAIKGTKFDYITGKLCENCESEIVASTTPHEDRYVHDIYWTRLSMFATIPASLPGQYVQITRSDMKIDFGQTTLPFFDALPLVSNPPTPLGGLGIFHKASEDFTGFISLKFLSLDYPAYMDNPNVHE